MIGGQLIFEEKCQFLCMFAKEKRTYKKFNILLIIKIIHYK